MAIPPIDIRILFTNYDITYLLNLASCSEHFIRIKHRILATFNKKEISITTACLIILFKFETSGSILSMTMGATSFFFIVICSVTV